MAKSSVSSALLTGKKEVYARLSQALGGRLKENVSLAPYTTFGIGGESDLFYQASTPEQLVRAVRGAQELKVRFLVLGGGSNVLVSDSGFRGLVIRNRCRQILTDGDAITCQSGGLLNDLVSAATEHSLSGLEFAAGIPGTVGGAVRGNAGAFGESLGDLLSRAVVLTESGEVKEVDRDYFRFAYRESRLKRTGEVLLSATFRLSQKDRRKIEERIDGILRTRKKSVPWQEKSAGCFFKNIIGPQGTISAGFLLDQIGAKGLQEGHAKVWPKHANIIINQGNAKAADIRRLAQKLKRKIRQQFDIELEEEVVYIN